MRPGAILTLLLAGLVWSCAGAGGAGEGRAPAVNVAVEDGGRHGPPCDVAQHRALVGQAMEQIDIDSLPRPLRIYREGSRITKDYRPERLNVEVGPEGRATGVWCG